VAHPPETRSALRSAYIHDRLSLEAASEKIGVPIGTARRWKSAAAADGDDWDRARAAASLSHGGANTIAQLVVADFLTLHQATVDSLNDAKDVPPLARAEAMSRLADAFSKTMNAAARAAPELGRFAVANELIQDLALFVRDERLGAEMTTAVIDILERFSVHVARKYG
jgi:hypothetical protein